MYKIGENEMVLCPYNRSHVVSKLRIQKHIIKCQDRHPEVKLVTCFYNYTHKLRPEDVLKHYEICSQKIRMEEARYCESNRHVSCNSEINDKSVYGSVLDEKALSFSNYNASSVKSDDTKYLSFKTSTSRKQSLNDIGKDDNGDDLRPLNLPKTVSKAFTSVKQQTEKSSALIPPSESILSQSKGFGRGKKFFLNPPRPKTNDHSLPHASDMENGCPKKIKAKSKYFLNNISDMGNSCSASVISSFFDDSTTLKSDNITFDAYDDDDDDDDGFIFKNFDKYVRI